MPVEDSASVVSSVTSLSPRITGHWFQSWWPIRISELCMYVITRCTRVRSVRYSDACFRWESAGLVAFTATSWKQLLDPKRMPAGERVPTASDCYRFVLSNPAIGQCMTGPANEEQAAEAMRANELGPMNEEELAWMRRVGDHIHKH